MSDRQIIVVDTETTGLDPARHSVVEVAWWNLHTGEHGAFVPVHQPQRVLATAEIGALRVNRYIDRLADAEQDRDFIGVRKLAEQLDGSVLAGSNPAFDAAFLERLFAGVEDECRPPRWHHRLLDLSAYAAGVLFLDPTELPGLRTICEKLGVEAPDHTAEGDVRATGLCFRALSSRAG